MNMNVSTLITLLTSLLLGWALVTLAAKPKNIYEFTKVECESLVPTHLKVLNCEVNSTTAGLFLAFENAEDVTKLLVIYKIAIEQGNKFITYATADINYCDSMYMVHSQALFQSILVGVRRVSNFPLACPFKKHERYYINGYKLDPKVVPVYLPQLTFRTVVTLVNKERQIGTITIYGELGRK